MSMPANQHGILVIWIVSTSLCLFYLFLILRWAKRSGQFKEMDRSRYLALKSRHPQ